jgi:hypothetical protein
MHLTAANPFSTSLTANISVVFVPASQIGGDDILVITQVPST